MDSISLHILPHSFQNLGARPKQLPPKRAGPSDDSPPTSSSTPPSAPSPRSSSALASAQGLSFDELEAILASVEEDDNDELDVPGESSNSSNSNADAAIGDVNSRADERLRRSTENVRVAKRENHGYESMSLFRPKPLRRWQRWRRRKRTSGRSRRRSCGILHVRPPTTRRSTTTLTNVRRPPSWPFILSKSPLCISSRHFQPAGAAGPREPSFCPLFRRRGGHHIGKLRQEARLTREIKRPLVLFLVSQIDTL